MALVSGNLYPTLLTLPIIDEVSPDHVMELLSADLYATLSSTGPYDEDAPDHTMALISGDLKYNLIQALTPDEGLDFVIVLTSGSMTSV